MGNYPNNMLWLGYAISGDNRWGQDYHLANRVKVYLNYVWLRGIYGKG